MNRHAPNTLEEKGVFLLHEEEPLVSYSLMHDENIHTANQLKVVWLKR